MPVENSGQGCWEKATGMSIGVRVRRAYSVGENACNAIPTLISRSTLPSEGKVSPRSVAPASLLAGQ